MAAKKPAPRREFPDLLEDPGELDPREIVDGEPVDDAYVSSGEFSGRTLSQLVVRRSVISAVSFAGGQIKSVRLKDVRFVRCDFSNTVLRGIDASRVEFIDCRFIGVKALECRMEDILFERCNGRYGQFQDGSAVRSEFVESQFEDADFRGVNLSHSKWTKSSFVRADVTGSKLQGCDLSGAETEGLLVAALDLHGAIVNPSQAMDFARLLGLTIR